MERKRRICGVKNKIRNPFLYRKLNCIPRLAVNLRLVILPEQYVSEQKSLNISEELTTWPRMVGQQYAIAVIRSSYT